MAAYRAFSINGSSVVKGAMVEDLALKGAGINVPAVIVGEFGRGRSRGVITVQGINKDDEGKYPRLMVASIGETKAGKPKFCAAPDNGKTDDDFIVIIFRTQIGFRGGNSHTGDRIGWGCSCGVHGDDEPVPEKCPNEECSSWDGPQPKFGEFPGEILTKGEIAQGDAGRMGSGNQLIAVMPKGVVFRTGYSGRLYGAPAAHYYMWDGERLLCATFEERVQTDIF